MTCALFCHAGHKLAIGGYGVDTKMICDCGSGKFDDCKTLNDCCPIKKLRFKTSCSVMRNNFKAL